MQPRNTQNRCHCCCCCCWARYSTLREATAAAAAAAAACSCTLSSVVATGVLYTSNGWLTYLTYECALLGLLCLLACVAVALSASVRSLSEQVHT